MKLEARAKKNINPLCFYAVPNIIMEVVTKKNVLSFEERENGTNMSYSINSKVFTYPEKYGCIIKKKEKRKNSDTSVSFTTLKRKGRKNTLHWGKENFSNNITLSSSLPINQK